MLFSISRYLESASTAVETRLEVIDSVCSKMVEILSSVNPAIFIYRCLFWSTSDAESKKDVMVLFYL